MATIQVYWYPSVHIISGMKRYLIRTTNQAIQQSKLDSYLTWKCPKSLEGFEPKAVRGKWFEVGYKMIYKIVTEKN
jgi:hypothetical protein